MPARSAINAVIFDMDGVLTDSEPVIQAAATAMFKEKGLIVHPEDFRPFVGTGEDSYLGGVARKYGCDIDLAGLKKRTYEIYLELVPLRLKAFPGAVELVVACKNAGLKVAVASSADRIKIDANLNKIGLPGEAWDAIVTAEDVVHKKPAPEIFLVTAQKLGLPPEQCVVIEDAVSGVQAAKAAGMRCVAVAHSFPVEQLAAADLVQGGISQVTIADLAAPMGMASTTAQSKVPLSLSTCTPTASTNMGSWGLWATLGFSLVIAAAFLGAQIAVAAAFMIFITVSGRGELLRGAEGEVSGLLLALATCASAPVGIGLTWLFAWLRRGMSVKDYLALRPVAAKEMVRWCLVLIVLVVLSDGLTALLGRPIVPEFMVRAYQTSYFPPLLLAAVIVGAPASEEIMFRGFLFKGILHSRFGGIGAVLVTSLIWAVIHGQYDQYGRATIFVVGLLLGTARLKTDSVFPGAAMHALMNLIAMLQVMARA
jgi:HAD superfamily hydrolase (TIGR01509 family)